MDVGQAPEQLVHVQLDINHGQGLFGSAVVSGHSVDSLRNVIQNQIQIHLIFLVSTGVEEVAQADYVAVVQLPHDLQLPILKPLVLQDLLDGHHLSGVAEFGLVDYAERAVADDLRVRVAHLLWPVRALTWSGHDCRYFAAIFIPADFHAAESRGLRHWFAALREGCGPRPTRHDPNSLVLSLLGDGDWLYGRAD